jgi:hypothetical protein
MKRARIIGAVVAIVLLFALSGEATAMTLRMRANIGFSFIANDRELPAGEYWIEMVGSGGGRPLGSTLVLRSADGAVAHTLFANAFSYKEGDQTAYLLFNRIGRSYFLSKARYGSLESSLVRSRSEKVLKLAYLRDWYGDYPEVVKIAASLK